MNARERFVRVLTGKDCDRVPFMKIFGGTNAVVEKWKDDYPLAHTYIDELLGFEGGYRGWRIAPVNTGLCGAPPDAEVQVTPTERHIRKGDGTLYITMNRDGHFFNHIAEYPVKNFNDWLNIKQNYMDPFDPVRFPKDWRVFADLYAARDYPLQLTCGGVYGFARHMLGDELLCYSLYDAPELVADVMDTYITMCIDIWKKMSIYIHFDVIECWEDMAYNSGPIISKEHFDFFMAPQYRRIRGFAEEAGIPLVLVDSDGYIMELSKWMYETGVNSMYPFEVQAGNSVETIRAALPGMGCIGGLDKECMARGKPAMDAELDKAAKLIPLGRFIPGPDHFVLENVPFDNYIYFMRGLKRVVMETRLG